MSGDSGEGWRGMWGGEGERGGEGENMLEHGCACGRGRRWLARQPGVEGSQEEGESVPSLHPHLLATLRAASVHVASAPLTLCGSKKPPQSRAEVTFILSTPFPTSGSSHTHTQQAPSIVLSISGENISSICLDPLFLRARKGCSALPSSPPHTHHSCNW